MAPFTLNNLFSLVVFTTLVGQISAHTWTEQMALISSNGSYTGAMGYPRNNIARTDPGFDGGSMNYLLPPLESGRTRINGSDLLCHPNQRVQTQSAKWPRLQVSAGSAIAMKYLENGHVSLPKNQLGKQTNGGTVYVFGTTNPSTTEALADVLEWTKDGTGGDKRGFLLAANDFDDLRCYQLNGGEISNQRQAQFPDPITGQPGSRFEQWCETDVIMPSDVSFVQTGKLLTLYWVWDWQTVAGIDPSLPTGKDEYYTTCSDVEIVANVPDSPLSNFLPQQDPQPLAVSNYMSRTALVVSPRGLSSGSSSRTSTAMASSVLATPAAQTPSSVIMSTAASSTTTSQPSTIVSAPRITQASASTPAAAAPLIVLSTIHLPAGAGLGPGADIEPEPITISSSSSSSTYAYPVISVVPTTTSPSSSTTDAPITYVLSTPSPTPEDVTLTTVITVVVTVTAGATSVVTGTHVLTFSAPAVAASATATATATTGFMAAVSFRA